MISKTGCKNAGSNSGKEINTTAPNSIGTEDYEGLIREAIRTQLRCPICGVLDDLEFEHLSQLQYQVLHHDSVSRSIVLSAGFCAFHFRRFRKIATSQTSARLLHDLCEAWASNSLPSNSDCVLCSANAHHENFLVEALVGLLREDRFRQTFEESIGLCLAHHRSVESGTKNEKLIHFLRETQQKQFKRLSDNLHTLGSKRFFDASKQERAAEPDAIEKFVGRKALGA